MNVNQGIFKAYDVRGVYPGEIDEEVAGEIGRAFVTYLGARRIGVSRDMRLSSPTIAAAFIEGALAQGCDVVDFGMMATDMLYFAVASRGARRRRADHRVAQPRRVQRHQDGAPRGAPSQRRGGPRRDPRHARQRHDSRRRRPRPAAARRRTSSPRTSTTSCRSSTRRSSSRSRWWPTRATAWAVSWRRRCLHGCPAA